MSPIAAPRRPGWRAPEPLAAQAAPTRAIPKEPLAVFGAAWIVYLAIGLYSTLGLHIVLGDAQSRLAHAYFVWWNDPPKLAAIGFYWPPLQTLALLPFTVVRPLAASLVALPIVSSFFAAALLVVLERALAFAAVERRWRFAIVAAFGLNPFVVYYAANGMAETMYLFLLALGLTLFLRWAVNPRWQHLPLMGSVFALGILTRYELFFWLLLVATGVAVVLHRRRATAIDAEASLISFLAPVTYALVLWAFINWALLGSPTAFLSVANAIQQAPHGTVLGFLADALTVQALLFPLVYVLVLPLVWIGVRTRDPVALVLAASLLVNVLVTFALAVKTREDVPLLLRYGIRALPLTVVAGAWLLSRLPVERRRRGAALLVAGLVLSAPATTATMLTSTNELGESAFLHGLFTGKSQDGLTGPRGAGISIADQRDMARFITARIHAPDSILADDSQTFGVMLADGHPERYFDRIDRGDTKWFAARDHPVGAVRYLLVKRGATRTEDPVFFDRILEAYPALDSRGTLPRFARLLHVNSTYALYAVHE